MRISDWSSDVCSSDLFCEHGSRSPTGCSPPSGSARFQVRKMRRRQIYEGKAKVLFEGPEPGTIVQYFKDDATAFNNQKTGAITGKGVPNTPLPEYMKTRLPRTDLTNPSMPRPHMPTTLVGRVQT